MVDVVVLDHQQPVLHSGSTLEYFVDADGAAEVIVALRQQVCDLRLECPELYH